MENLTEKETIEKARELLQGVQTDFLKTSPMWLRVRYLCNLVSKAIEDGNEEDINWNKVNEFLLASVDEYDFNMATEVHSFTELDSIHNRIIEATVLNWTWQKHKCKDCGKEFYLNYGEVMFYKDKELHIPKRCKDCRAKRKVGK